MRLSITSSKMVNPFTHIFIHRLMTESFKPEFVVLAQKSKINRFRNQIKKHGLRNTIKRIFSYKEVIKSIYEDGKNYLKAYAEKNGIENILCPLSNLCKQNNIPLIKVNDINSTRSIEVLKEKKIDLIINTGGGIFRKALISAPNIGILNAHMGFLPAFRGMNVLEWSLFYDHKIGVTVHFINQGIDLGDIILFREISIDAGDSISALRQKSMIASVELLIQAIKLIKDKKEIRIKQKKEEGKQYFVMHYRLRSILEKKLKNIQI